jgi:hypothetical protein
MQHLLGTLGILYRKPWHRNKDKDRDSKANNQKI